MPSEEDLNVEHLQLLLLIFHNLSEKGRRTVLTLCTQAIAEVATHVDSQLQSVPLNLARILLVFDYLLHQYSKAPVYLFEQVRKEIRTVLIFNKNVFVLVCVVVRYGLFYQVQYNLLTPPASGANTAQEGTKRGSTPLYYGFKEVEENWAKHCSADWSKSSLLCFSHYCRIYSANFDIKICH